MGEKDNKLIFDEERIPLAQFVTEYSVRNKADENIPVYSVTNSQGFCREYFGKEVASKDKTTYKIVPYGYFAYNPSRINVGSVDWQRCEERVIVSPLYNVFSVTDELDRQYLYYFLRSDVGRQIIRFKASGSVRDNLKLEMLKEMTIPNISVKEQQERALRLDKINSLIQMRKKELEQLDTLIKARFVEMFGDLANPECEWKKERIIDICCNSDDIKCGPFGTQLNKDEYQEAGVAVWEIPQINSVFKESPIHFLTTEKAEQLSAYSLLPGDIAMSRKGNVGRCAVFPENFEPGIIHSDVLRIRVDQKKILPIFLMHQLHFSGAVQHQISIVSSGAIMAGINVTKLKEIFVHVPPVELQNEFVAFTAQVDKSKFDVDKIY